MLPEQGTKITFKKAVLNTVVTHMCGCGGYALVVTDVRALDKTRQIAGFQCPVCLGLCILDYPERLESLSLYDDATS